MKLTYLRGATVIIECAGKRILCDPWLVDGIYYGAWAHYPPWTEDDWQRYRPWDVDYVYISHIHPDHFDSATMSRIPRSVPVLINNFPSKFLKRRIEAGGHDVIEIDSGTPYPLGRTGHIRIFPADACNPQACGKLFSCAPSVNETQIDSLCVLHDGQETIVNVNDCPYSLAHKVCKAIRAQYGQIDIALVAFAGAGPWPQCFVLGAAECARAANLKKQMFLQTVVNFANDLGARRILPFAGEYQLCGSLSRRNESRGIPERDEACQALRNMGVTVIEPDSPFGDRPGNRVRYVNETLAGRCLDYDIDPDVRVDDLVPPLMAASARLNAKCATYQLKTKGAVYFELNDACWWRRGSNGDAALTAKIQDEDYITIKCDHRLLRRLLTGPHLAHWNNAEIGSHLTFSRCGPYEAGLHHMMSFLHV